MHITWVILGHFPEGIKKNMYIFFLDKDFIYLRRLISRLDEWEVLIFSSNSRQECEWVCFPKCQTLYFFYMAVLVILLCYIPFSYSSCHSNALQHPITLCMCTNTHTHPSTHSFSAVLVVTAGELCSMMRFLCGGDLQYISHLTAALLHSALQPSLHSSCPLSFIAFLSLVLCSALNLFYFSVHSYVP